VVERYKAKVKPDAPQRNPVYAAMIESMDENVGKLLGRLDTTGLAGSTAVIFTSDNGGWLPSTNTNLGLRAGKGSAYEGGVRAPFLVRWPGVTRNGALCEIPVCGIDVAPTLAAATGSSIPNVDGKNILPLLREPRGRGWQRNTLFWHYPHYHPGGAKPYSAIRFADRRLIEFHEDQRVELYDFAKDPEETKDLAASNTRVRDELRSRLHKWRKETGAQMPRPNENFDPVRAGLTAAQAKAKGLL
jgi:arylsulfatase A